MAAYLAVPFIDVQFFHLWKKLTCSKYHWLRNNASTFTSQLIDTVMVLALPELFGAIEGEYFGLKEKGEELNLDEL